MKFNLFFFAFAIALNSFASTVKDLGPEGVAFAEALSKCSNELKEAASLSAYVSKVTYFAPRPSNPKIVSEGWEVTFSKGGFAIGAPRETVATLIASRTVDNSGPFVPDRPARVTYSCELDRR